MNNMSDEEQKSAAGRRAAAFVHDGMRVGLGTGSTVRHTILELGRRIEQGLRIEGVPTSRATQSLAEDLGIPLRGQMKWNGSTSPSMGQMNSTRDSH